jgi:putative PIN family toxin of toxin-antitoxin system
MVVRKKRILVVIDTNVFVRNFKARRNTNANRRVIRLWLLEKRLQLIVSREIVAEYLDIFHEVVGMDAETIEQWRLRFEEDSRSTLVRLAYRYTASRDPDDNLMLATARSGQAKYLITNDRDLLDLPDLFRRTLPFTILRPQEFLQELEESR